MAVFCVVLQNINETRHWKKKKKYRLKAVFTKKGNWDKEVNDGRKSISV